MTRPLVSICIPTYERPADLETAIASVLVQGDDLEVVVSDNARSGEQVVARLADPRIRYFRNPENLGPIGNTNAALDRARGRYLGVLHDDDRLLPGFLDCVLLAFDSDPAPGVVFTDHYLETPSGRLEERGCELHGSTYQDFVRPLLEHMPVAMSAAVMRREVWERARPLPDLLTMDYVLYLRAALAGCVFHYVDEVLMVYRVHPDQLSNRSVRLRRDLVTLWEQLEFRDPACEQLRRRHLANALVGRAGAAIRAGRASEAAADIDRAVELDSAVRTARVRLIRGLAAAPSMAALVVAAADGRGRVRAVLGGRR